MSQDSLYHCIPGTIEQEDWKLTIACYILSTIMEKVVGTMEMKPFLVPLFYCPWRYILISIKIIGLS